MNFTNVEDYHKARDALINEDRSKRVDHGKQYSPDELLADNIVRTIRAQEAVAFWSTGEHANSVYHSEEDTPHIFPGMEFLTARETIVKTELFRILSKMPKGAMLHAHLDATVNAKILLELALKHPSIHVRTSAQLSATNLSVTHPSFQPLPEAEFTTLSNISDETYQPGGWVPIQKARETFDPTLGGPEGFDRWVIDSLMINPSEAYRKYNTTTKIWRKFLSTFDVSSNLVRFAPIWSAYIREFLISCLEDGICYAEPRINFRLEYMYSAEGLNNVPHREWVRDFDEVVKQLKAERPQEFIGARIIYSTIRYASVEEIEWYLEDCLQLAQEFPHLIAGFDLVGHEDSLEPLITYVEPFKRFVARQKEFALDIPFILHAGETLGDGSKPDLNLYDAILLGTKRIGHGYSLVKHPKLMEICRNKGIALEVCPISNEILRLTSSMPMHPLPILINQGVPVVLSSDDPAVFGNLGVTFDYFQVLVASEVTGLLTLSEIAKDSIKYSTMNEEDKARASTLWQAGWQRFVQFIIREYGGNNGIGGNK
ncbi:Metallo-dependent hydrolase [Abortiporus biennis]|nr:Metallo-dependent hydrolase [Abortiporus biennis]